jgi:hypothetical protein
MAPRQTPHRQRRDRRTARERADLKRERDYLTKQNRRLQEDLEKAREAKPRKPKVEVALVTPKVTGLRCWACPCEDVRVVDLGTGGEWLVCPFCKARKRRSPSRPSSSKA